MLYISNIQLHFYSISNLNHNYFITQFSNYLFYYSNHITFKNAIN
uniref:Uncharacterized protein n=1 Tax=Cryptosporidium parvum TaxID=5807 RepID=F0X5P6_CRYPV